MDRHVSYVSGVELEQKKPSLEFLRLFTEQLDLPPQHFLYLLRDPRSIVNNEFLEFVRIIRLGPSIANRATTPSHVATTPALARRLNLHNGYCELFDTGEMLSAFGYILNQCCLLDDKEKAKEDILLLWHGSNHFTRTPEHLALWRHYLAMALSSGVNVSHIIRLNSDVNQMINQVKLLITNITRNITFPGHYRVAVLNGLLKGDFPSDFTITLNCGAVIALTTSDINETDAGLYFSKVPDTFVQHFNYANTFASEIVRCYKDNEKEDFLAEFAKSESARGDRLMAQTFFSSITRPPKDFKPGTPWHERHADKSYLKQMIASRNQRIRALRERLQGYKFQQICLRSSILSWIETGYRTRTHLVGNNVKYYEPITERIERIENIVSLLRQYDRFEIALIDDLQREKLGWGEDEVPDVAWVVENGDAVIFDSWYLNNDDTRKQFQILVRQEMFNKMAVGAFRLIWDSLPHEEKNKPDVIVWLEEQRRTLIQRKE